MPLTAGAGHDAHDWVDGGGNLIAMRPDPQLAGLLGLTDAGGTLANAYLQVDTSASPGAGIVGETIQFHGTADRYTLSGATTRRDALLRRDDRDPEPRRHAAQRRLERRPGRGLHLRPRPLGRLHAPGQPGLGRPGARRRAGPIRSDDLFFGAAAGDSQPDWVDLNKVAIPQADEQQRLLANLIRHMNVDRKPLPRFWYFPRGEKAAVVMTGDDHGNGGTAGRFDQYKATSPAGCSVADWECVRSTSYVYPNTRLDRRPGAPRYEAHGFEIALHVEHRAAPNWTRRRSLESLLLRPARGLRARSTRACPRRSPTAPTASPGATGPSQPEVELDHGIRLDTNYYYWPPGWVQNRPGMFTGSGMPMRFADLDGTMIDVYQAATQMTDESGQTYPFNVDTLLDKALGAEGYYGAFTANMHTDSASHAGSDAIVASAQARGVPVVSARQMLEWLDGRNASSFESLAWNGNTLSFTSRSAPAPTACGR